MEHKGQVSLAIVAVVVVAIVGLLLLTGRLDSALEQAGLPPVGQNLQSYLNITVQLPAAVTLEPETEYVYSDLRAVYQPYINAAPNAPAACVAAGGEWEWQSGWAGCAGAGGGANCNTALAAYLGELCRAADAQWTCDLWSAYCRR